MEHLASLIGLTSLAYSASDAGCNAVGAIARLTSLKGCC
jgi:hypothetical protein